MSKLDYYIHRRMPGAVPVPDELQQGELARIQLPTFMLADLRQVHISSMRQNDGALALRQPVGTLAGAAIEPAVIPKNLQIGKDSAIPLQGFNVLTNPWVVSCEMACCGMSNALVSTAKLPNASLITSPFGNSAIAPNKLHNAQQAISQLSTEGFLKYVDALP